MRSPWVWLPRTCTYVDPIWRNVMRMVCKSWRTYVKEYKHSATDFTLTTIRKDAHASVVIAHGSEHHLYVRATRGTQIYGMKMKRIHSDINGDQTYTNLDAYGARPMKYFRVDAGRIGRIHHS